MPELPEVEIARRHLAGWAAGRRVVAARFLEPTTARPNLSTRPSGGGALLAAQVADALVGTTATAPCRHGKRLGWRFSGPPDAAVLVHLGMSGKWIRRDDDAVPHGRLRLDFEGGIRLWFVDPRRFGCVSPVAADRLEAALAAGLGPDALLTPLDGPALKDRLASRRPIKAALLDQSRIAGLGNLHAAEALWRARVDPARPGTSLSETAWRRLARAIPAQLAETVAAEEGGTIRYLSEGGAPSSFAVYRRAGAACRRCGATILRTTHAGRATFWCPGCQT